MSHHKVQQECYRQQFYILHRCSDSSSAVNVYRSLLLGPPHPADYLFASSALKTANNSTITLTLFSTLSHETKTPAVVTINTIMASIQYGIYYTLSAPAQHGRLLDELLPLFHASELPFQDSVRRTTTRVPKSGNCVSIATRPSAVPHRQRNLC